MGRETKDETKGERGNVHIRIAYSGNGQPGPILVQRCLDLVKALHGDNAGTVVRNAPGGGVVEIVVVTADADRTTQIAWKHVNQLGLSSRTTVRAEAVARRGER